MKDGKPFAFARLRERWQPEGAEALDSRTIIFTTANELISQIHDRMPVILAPQIAIYGFTRNYANRTN